MVSCPFVFWAQDATKLFLTVDLKNSSDVKAEVIDDRFEFEAIGLGAQGRKKYCFSLQLHDKVQLRPQALSKGGSSLRFVLDKEISGWWPSVTKDQKRISWLRIDFDRFKDPDDSDDSAEGFEMINSSNKASYDEKLNELAEKVLNGVNVKPQPYGEACQFLGELRSTIKSILTFYLVAYNVLMFIFHFYILIYLLFYYIADGTGFLRTFWHEKSFLIKFVTSLQLFDVIHSLSGITKTGTFASLMQVFGRLTVLHVIDGYPYLHSVTSTFSLMVVYFLIEIFRYPYYAVSCLKKEYKLTTWLRYNMWIPLYPSGFILEAITLLRAIPFYYENDVFSIKMPNAANISFNFGIFLGFLLLLLPLIGTYLLYYMFHQRRKKFIAIQKKLR